MNFGSQHLDELHTTCGFVDASAPRNLWTQGRKVVRCTATTDKLKRNTSVSVMPRKYLLHEGIAADCRNRARAHNFSAHTHKPRVGGPLGRRAKRRFPAVNQLYCPGALMGEGDLGGPR